MVLATQKTGGKDVLDFIFFLVLPLFDTPDGDLQLHSQQ